MTGPSMASYTLTNAITEMV